MGMIFRPTLHRVTRRSRWGWPEGQGLLPSGRADRRFCNVEPLDTLVSLHQFLRRKSLLVKAAVLAAAKPPPAAGSQRFCLTTPAVFKRSTFRTSVMRLVRYRRRRRRQCRTCLRLRSRHPRARAAKSLHLRLCPLCAPNQSQTQEHVARQRPNPNPEL